MQEIYGNSRAEQPRRDARRKIEAKHILGIFAVLMLAAASLAGLGQWVEAHQWAICPADTFLLSEYRFLTGVSCFAILGAFISIWTIIVRLLDRLWSNRALIRVDPARAQTLLPGRMTTWCAVVAPGLLGVFLAVNMADAPYCIGDDGILIRRGLLLSERHVSWDELRLLEVECFEARGRGGHRDQGYIVAMTMADGMTLPIGPGFWENLDRLGRALNHRSFRYDSSGVKSSCVAERREALLAGPSSWVALP